MYPRKQKQEEKKEPTKETDSLLPDDILLLPLSFLFDQEKNRFDLKFIEELTQAEAAAIQASIRQGHFVRCKIRSIDADGAASVEIAIPTIKDNEDKSKTNIYAEIKVKEGAAVNGLEIFRYVKTSNTPKASGESRHSVRQFVTAAMSSLKQPPRFDWISADLSATPNVIQLWRKDEKLSSFKVNLVNLTEKMRLLKTREILHKYERSSSGLGSGSRSRSGSKSGSAGSGSGSGSGLLFGSGNMVDTRTDSNDAKKATRRRLMEELAGIDVLPNLFDAKSVSSGINQLLTAFRSILVDDLKIEHEIEHEISMLYEFYLQEIFPLDSAIGSVIGQWNNDVDKDGKDKLDLPRRESFMDLLTVINMLLENKFEEGELKKKYPQMIAQINRTTFPSITDDKPNAGAGSPRRTSSKKDINEENPADCYKRRFAKLIALLPRSGATSASSTPASKSSATSPYTSFFRSNSVGSP